MIPESRLIFGGLTVAARLSMRRCSTSRSVGQTLADDALHDQIGPGHVVDAKPDAVVVPEVKLGGIAMQMGLTAMLVDADHPALEDAVEAFDGVGVDFAAPILASAMGDEIMLGEVFGDLAVLPGFVGHDVRTTVHVRLDDGQQIGGGSSAYMERHDPRALGTPLDQRQDGVLVGVSPGLGGFLLLGTVESFVNLHDGTLAAHWLHAEALHRLTDTVREEPRGLESDAENSVKLVAAHALLGSAKQVHCLQPDVQRDMAGLHDGADSRGKRLAADIALAHTEFGGLAVQPPDAFPLAAARAGWAIRPNARLDERQGCGFIVEVISGQDRVSHGSLL